MKGISKHKKSIIGAIAIIVFIFLFRSILKEQITSLDKFAYDILVDTLRNDYLTIIMKAFTYLCSITILLFICVVTFIYIKDKIKASLISINLIINFLINTVLKYLIRRPRPTGYRLIEESGFSFPSGHSMVAMAFYGYIMYLIYKNEKVIWKRNLLIFLLGFIIVMIGTSRIYLGVHYASDVCAGFCLSVAYLMLFITYSPKIVDYLKNQNKAKKSKKKRV
jgi:undecaprenyl-diphosphatase